ncbi:MAG: alpha/beta fold hydrolase [Bacteroidota bacterium]
MEFFDIEISIGKIRVYHHQNYPNRPTLVFLHDSLGCIELWRDFPKKLGELAQCNILIYDRQGYGKSSPFSNPVRDNSYMEGEADILPEILAKCSIDQAILFGHSDGGSIALIAAAKYPQGVLAIVTEGAHIFVEEVTVKGIKAAITAYHTTDLKTKLTKYHGDKTEAMFRAWANTWTTEEFSAWNIEHFLPSITCSSLIVQGENDEYGTLKQVDGIVNQVSGAVHKFILPNVSHSPHKEAPEKILRRSAEFILSLI